jgi:hypothetical protein
LRLLWPQRDAVGAGFLEFLRGIVPRPNLLS